jgi:hypothetical protein
VLFGHAGLSSGARLVVEVLVSVVAAGVLHEVVEKPFLALRDRVRDQTDRPLPRDSGFDDRPRIVVASIPNGRQEAGGGTEVVAAAAPSSPSSPKPGAPR